MLHELGVPLPLIAACEAYIQPDSAMRCRSWFRSPGCCAQTVAPNRTSSSMTFRRTRMDRLWHHTNG